VIVTADDVVVGSGAFGASAAYHLARRGLQVAVLDRSGLASQTSPRAAGLTSQVRATPALTKLAQRAVTKLAAFTDETGEPLRFTQSGALRIARGRAAGVPIDLVSIAEAPRRLPILGERGIAAITWSATDGHVEPSELPIVPTRHQLLITEPIPGVGPEFPIARVIDANVYVRHERGGLMLGGYESDPLQLDAAALPPSFDMAELPLDLDVLWRLARSVSEQFPIFQDPAIRVAEHRGGLPTLTMDDRYLVGPVPGVSGAWVMSGCCVGGLSVSPALGESIAEWIVDGAPALDLSDVSIARFAGREVDETELRERCRRAYASHYRASGERP
jgi:glycine/D-amino acid oxidase-like deaminating enzyme